MTVIPAVAVLVGVLVLATVLGLVLRARTGRATTVGARTADGRSGRTGRSPARTSTRTASTLPSAADIAPTEAFGARATLVQFSTPTCARCPGTARQLDALAARHDGVERVEIDLTRHPDLASRFNVLQTPTVLLLDGDRSVRTRFGGPPRPPELAAALDTVLTQESR